jgi:PAS domain S-box-containing protein
LDLMLKEEEGELRSSGIGVVGRIPWGTHLCQFYETKEDLIDILVPYFAEGLRDNEFCMWITSQPLDEGEAKVALKEAVPDLEDYVAKGQIEIISYSDWYIRGGTFDADGVLKGWVEKESRALGRHFDGLRLSGNTFWLEKDDWQDFVDYEALINGVIKEHRMIAICTYSLDRCGSRHLIDVMRNHESTLIRKKDAWTMVDDVLKRRALENHIVQSRQIFEIIYDRSPIGIELYDADGQLLNANKACLDVFGVSDVSEVKGFKLFEDPNLSYEAKERLRDGEIVRYEALYDFEKVRQHGIYKTTKSGKIYIDALITPLSAEVKKPWIGYLVQVMDVTSRKMAEEERLKAMGLVARSIAHDIRNPLSAIRTAAYLLGSYEDGRKRLEMTNLIDRNVVYADNLVRNLIDFSSPHQFEFVKEDANALLREALDKIVLPDGVRLTCRYGDIPAIKLDRNHLAQALTNLLMNAIQAMPDGGELAVSTAQAGNFVELRIRDTGVGIPKEELGRIFEPFHTTKAKGVGLGLINAKRDIVGHGGTIALESEENKGTVAIVRLPIAIGP